MVNAFLSQVRPQEFYDKSKNGSSVKEICRILDAIEEQSNNVTAINLRHVDVSLDYRYDRPFEKSHQSSRVRFFLYDLNSLFENGLSHFSVQRDIFPAFFGSNFLPLFDSSQVPVESVSNPVQRENVPRNKFLSTTNQPGCTQDRSGIPSGELTTISIQPNNPFLRVTKTPGKRGPLRRMCTIWETIVRGQDSVDASNGLSDERGEGQASQKQEIQLQNDGIIQSQELTSEHDNMLVQSEGQAPYEEEVEMHDTDVIQIVEQTEEPIPHEPEIRQGETKCPAQPLAQSGNDEVDEPLEVIEAPCEKFSLPLGSQAERPSLTRHEPYRITSPATEQNQEVTLPKQNVFEMWNKKCGEDDWILVNVENSSCRYIPTEDHSLLNNSSQRPPMTSTMRFTIKQRANYRQSSWKRSTIGARARARIVMGLSISSENYKNPNM